MTRYILSHNACGFGLHYLIIFKAVYFMKKYFVLNAFTINEGFFFDQRVFQTQSSYLIENSCESRLRSSNVLARSEQLGKEEVTAPIRQCAVVKLS